MSGSSSRSPIRVVADPVGARPSNNIFGALAEDEAGDGAEEPNPQFFCRVSVFLELVFEEYGCPQIW